ncbi:MAG: TIGR02206 family membrane protein [Ruminococcaceae bacterium]|nr:TIGR02206 family membrane protein [Oscillospiraceae bacterium]
MKDFFAYFFGQGDTVEFSLLTPAHFVPILVMLAVIFLIYRKRDALRQSRCEENLRYVLAFALILTDMSYYWRLIGVPALNPNPVEHLPIGVCGCAVILCSYMVVGKKQSLFDIVYFWLLSGSLFALITPTPITYTGPTRFRYYQFWLEHTLGYVAIFYMIFVHGMRPTVRSAIKSYAALVILAVIAYNVNVMLPGANYLYMARPEAAPSVLDILPANFALRLAVMAFAIAVMYVLAYLPWYCKDRRAAQAQEEVGCGV